MKHRMENQASPFWARVSLERQVDGAAAHVAELKQVPGVTGHGATQEEATAAAHAAGCEVLGERGAGRGELLVEWLNALATQGSLVPYRYHHRDCTGPTHRKPSAPWVCHEDCLVRRTREAVRNDASLPQPTTSVQAHKPEAA